MIVDCAVYVEGARRGQQLRVEEALEATRQPGAFVWIGLYEPTTEEFGAVSRELGLHELAVEDALKAHQRPKLEVYDEDLFVVLKPARYDDAAESIELGEIQLFIGERYVVSVRHGQASALGDVRAAIEADMARMRCGPMAVLHAVVDRVVDDYVPVLEGIDNDLAEIEHEVFTADRPRGLDPSQRIFQLKREVLDLHRNTEPLLEPLAALAAGQVPRAHPELHDYFRDALDANLAQVTVRQNDDMRTISAWVAIAGLPTVVGAVYGMNFEHMPELGWRWSYLVVLVLTASACFALYRRFKRIGWL